MRPDSKDSGALLNQGITSFAWFLNNQQEVRQTKVNGEETKIEQLKDIKKIQEMEKKFNNYQQKKKEVRKVVSYFENDKI